MPTPQINSIELTSGSEVVLTTDPASPAYNEFVLYGTDLSDTQSVDLESGSDFSWVVSGISASANSVTVSAYAFGDSSGSGSVYAVVHTSDSRATSPTMEVDFVVLPLLD